MADGLTRANTSSILSLDLTEGSFFGAATKIGLDVAVCAADEVGLVPKAVGIIVAGSRSGVSDFAASLASRRGEVPFADGVVVTRGGIGVVRAILAANTIGVVPPTLNIVVASDVGGVDEGAAKSTFRTGDDPGAHRVVLAIGGDEVVGAESFAALSIGVPSASNISIA